MGASTTSVGATPRQAGFATGLLGSYLWEHYGVIRRIMGFFGGGGVILGLFA